MCASKNATILPIFAEIVFLLFAFLIAGFPGTSCADNEFFEKNLTPDDIVESLRNAVWHYGDYIGSEFRTKEIKDAGSLYSHLDDENKDALFAKARELAEAGNHLAQMMLGLLYFGGHGTSQSLPEARHWWHESTLQGYPESFYLLGIMSLIEQNYKESAEHLKIAADLGYSDAMFLTALNYYYGNGGLHQSNARFYFWAKQAQLAGSKLLKAAKVRWPVDQDPMPYLGVDMVLTMAEVNTMSDLESDPSMYGADYQQALKETLLSYSDHCDIDRNTNLLLPKRLPIMIAMSSVLRGTLGDQGAMVSLKEQPAKESNETLSKMFAPYSVDTFEIIYSDKYKPDDPNAMSIPLDSLVERLCPGNLALLSDTVIHHYTFVYSIDLEKGLVYLADGWPQDFFLLKDNNVMLIEASLIPFLHGRFLVQVKLEDFKKVLVGAIVQKR